MCLLYMDLLIINESLVYRLAFKVWVKLSQSDFVGKYYVFIHYININGHNSVIQLILDKSSNEIPK